MNKQHFFLFKIKEGKLNVWKEWCNELMHSRKEEAIATFADENVKRETFVMFTTKEGNFVTGRNEYIEDLRKGSPDVQINIDHKIKMRECLEPLAPGDIICDLLS